MQNTTEGADVRAYVLNVHILSPQTHRDDRTDTARLEEAVGLAQAIRLDVRGQRIARLHRVSPRTLIGRGVVDELASVIQRESIKLVVVDGTVSPIQQRNLEKAWHCKVIDRTGLILEIFGERARTAEGRLQVELAALTYQRSRLVRSWTHLERQRGGFGFVGGPGETQIELDRRIIGDRIVKIKKELEQTKKTRGLHRQARQRVPYPIVALVGYTNAGKSTLFNKLTRAEVFAEDLLFATLDPTMRLLKLPSGREVILSDTVGFISNLPTTLVAAFRATLEEVTEADLILHVRDSAHPDSQFQARDVEKVLEELGLKEVVEQGKLIDIYNKIDQLDILVRTSLLNKIPRSASTVGVSALTGENVDQLLALLDQRLDERRRPIQVTLEATQGRILAWCYRRGAIIDRVDEGTKIFLTLRLDPEDVDRFWELYRSMDSHKF